MTEERGAGGRAERERETERDREKKKERRGGKKYQGNREDWRRE